METETTHSPLLHNTLRDILDQLRGAWRFRWVALIVAWSLAAVLWIAVYLFPSTYQSSAEVFVNLNTTLSEATEGLSVGESIESQVQQVQQALVGDPQLRKVAEETNLMAGVLSPEDQQQVIDNLRANITVSAQTPDVTGQPSKTPLLKPTSLLFTITYTDHNLRRSLQVVSHLVNDFVEGSLGDKQQGSEQAEKFLTAQISEYGQRLSASEQRLADFKKRNVGLLLLGGGKGDYFARLQSENDALTTQRERLSLAQRRVEQLRQELRSGQQFTLGTTPAAPFANPAALNLEQQISQTQQKLNQLLLSYTEKYPGVIAMRQDLKALKLRQKVELAAARKGDLDAASELQLAANPVYEKLQEEYNDEQVEAASLQQDISDHERRIAKLKVTMGAAPKVQAEYAQLNRDYSVTRDQYDKLLARLDSARLGQQAALTGIVGFDIVQPATAQYQPVAPNRPRLTLEFFALALAAGLGLAYLLHMLRPVFASTRQLATVTGLTVLGSVGRAWLDRHHVKQRRSNVAYTWCALGLVVTGTTVFLLEFFIPTLGGVL